MRKGGIFRQPSECPRNALFYPWKEFIMNVSPSANHSTAHCEHISHTACQLHMLRFIQCVTYLIPLFQCSAYVKCMCLTDLITFIWYFLKQFADEKFRNCQKMLHFNHYSRAYCLVLILSLTRSSHLQCNYILMRMSVTKWCCGLCKSLFLAPWVIKKWKEYDCWVKMIKRWNDILPRAQTALEDVWCGWASGMVVYKCAGFKLLAKLRFTQLDSLISTANSSKTIKLDHPDKSQAGLSCFFSMEKRVWVSLNRNDREENSSWGAGRTTGASRGRKHALKGLSGCVIDWSSLAAIIETNVAESTKGDHYHSSTSVSKH